MNGGVVTKFVDYVSQYAPAFAQNIEGVPESEIAEFENISAHKLPEAYREFLALMGHRDGGLDLGQGSTTGLREVLQYYRDFILTGEEQVPPDTALISVGGVGAGDLGLSYGAAEEPRVVNVEDGNIKSAYAESFLKLLFRIGFIKYKMAAFPASAIYTSARGRSSLSEASQFAEQSGFAAQWFSDFVAFCGEQEDSALAINQFENMGLWLRIAARTPQEVERIGDAFVRRIGVSFDTWWPRS